MNAVKGVPLAECRECHEPIRFVRLTTSGKAMPVNPLPHASGTVAARLLMGRLSGFVISTEHRAGPSHPLRMVPHYATCEEQRPNRPDPTPTEEPLW